MSRRSTPDRIVEAWEAGTHSWLRMTLRQPDARVDQLLAGWAVEAEKRGLRRLDSAYWDEARPWLADRAR
jgi:hypothetical protein